MIKTSREAKARICVRGSVLVEHRNKEGKLLFRKRFENTVMLHGLTWLRARAGNGSVDPANYIGLSSNTSAPANTATDLLATVFTDDGLARALGAYGVSGDYAFTIYKLFTKGAGADKTVGSLGLYYAAATPDNLFAGVVCTPSAILTNGDTLAITWTVTMAAT